MFDRDPWDPIYSLQTYGKHVLTSVEVTVSQLCNMRCEHCAVGETLLTHEGRKLPLDLLLRRLDEVETLQTISITGGEPTYDLETVKQIVLPLLQYAKKRGLRTQINTNLTFDFDRYELIAPYMDVFHISYNYLSAGDFHTIGFANADRSVSGAVAERLFERMKENAIRLARQGAFVSAESMINYRTHESIVDIHREIVEMGCRRHEVHPMYPSSFAQGLSVLPLEQTRRAVERLLDGRDTSVWMLFGTLPFFACSPHEADRALLSRLKREPMVTVRNDPDGRNRLNVNLLTGDVYVTDFSDVPSFGNVRTDRFTDLFERWLGTELQQSVSCHCLEAVCCGPNLLVKETYYRDVDFLNRKAILG